MNDLAEKENNNKLLCSFDRLTSQYLQEGAKWARFLSIVGLILLFIMLCGGILNFSMIAAISIISPMFHDARLLYTLFILYIVFVLIYAFPLYYLYQASDNILSSIRIGNLKTFESGLKYLKTHYKYIGIYTIVVLSFYVLVFLAFFINLYRAY